MSKAKEVQAKCRICWGNSPSLLSPCLCEKVHKQCLESWIETVVLKNPKRMKIVQQGKNKYRCQICQKGIKFDTSTETTFRCMSCKQIAGKRSIMLMIVMCIFMVLWVGLFSLGIGILSHTQFSDLWSIALLTFVDFLPVPFFLYYFLIEKNKRTKVELKNYKTEEDQQSKKHILVS